MGTVGNTDETVTPHVRGHYFRSEDRSRRAALSTPEFGGRIGIDAKKV
jgi:hypothetical protein